MNRVNTDTYQHRILRSLRQVIRAVDIYSRKLNTDLGLTTPQLLCLEAISRKESITLTALAQDVHLGASTVNGIIDRLEEKQYVLRKRSDRDRREVRLEMTASGREILSRAPSLLQDKLSASFEKLTELEQETITLSLEKIVKLMEAEKIDASPNLFSRDKIVP